jgi:hypothetical protein
MTPVSRVERTLRHVYPQSAAAKSPKRTGGGAAKKKATKGSKAFDIVPGERRSVALELPEYAVPLPSPLDDPVNYPSKAALMEDFIEARLAGNEHIHLDKWELASSVTPGVGNYWAAMARPDARKGVPLEELDTYACVQICDPEDAARLLQQHHQKPFLYGQVGSR